MSRATRAAAFGLALTALAGPAAAAEPWTPAPGTNFFIALSVAPATVTTNAAVVDLDLFDTTKATVLDLRRRGKKAICYLNAGAWENWRPDKDRYPAVILGKAYDGWPGERWVDIRDLTRLGPILRARLDLCRAKGFHAVDPDNLDGYQADTGFPITRAHQLRFLRWLAREARARGLSIGLKNVPDLARYVVADFQFAVTEDCFDQRWCGASQVFTKAGKAVFAIEYTDNRIDFAAFCARAATLKLSPLLKRRNLDLWEKRCPAG